MVSCRADHADSWPAIGLSPATPGPTTLGIRSYLMLSPGPTAVSSKYWTKLVAARAFKPIDISFAAVVCRIACWYTFLLYTTTAVTSLRGTTISATVSSSLLYAIIHDTLQFILKFWRL